MAPRKSAGSASAHANGKTSGRTRSKLSVTKEEPTNGATTQDAAEPAQDAAEPDSMEIDPTQSTVHAKKVVEKSAAPKKRGAKRLATPHDEEDAPTVKRSRARPSAVNGTKRADASATILNALPGIPAKMRPSQHLFIFGNGEMAQLGLGVDVLNEIRRPKLHTWFEEKIEDEELGGPGAGIEKACTGGMHTLVTDEMGRIWSWGVNDNASLGRPTFNVPNPDAPGEIYATEVLETQPMLVQSLVDEGFRAVAVAAGDSISVALDAEGQLRCWGSFRSSDGLLGFDGKVGSAQRQFLPAPIEDFKKEKFVALACGTDHVLALTTEGRIWVWGNGQQAQLGRKIIERRKTNALRPEKLALKKIVAVGSGSYHSFAIDYKGRVFAWGLNSMKQTGVSFEDGGSEDIITSPTEVKALSPDNLGGERVVQISGGEHHTLFLVSDGRVYACGRSDGFELGIGPIEPMEDADGDSKMDGDESHMRSYVAVPTLVSFPPEPTPDNMNPPVPEGPPTIPPINPISSIRAGTHHNLAVSRAGYIYAWGTGNQSQLGLGDEEEVDRPVRLRYKDGDKWSITSAGAGGQHCIFLAVPKQGGDE